MVVKLIKATIALPWLLLFAVTSPLCVTLVWGLSLNDKSWRESYREFWDEMIVDTWRGIWRRK